MIVSALTYVLPMDTMLRSPWPKPAAGTPVHGCALPEPILRIGTLGPHCMRSRRPRPPQFRIPPTPTKASGIAELREWRQQNERWLELSRWSRGIVALDRPVRPRRPDIPVEAMTVQQLADTQFEELESVSRTAHDEIGVEVLALDWKYDPEAGTLADAVGEDMRQYLAVEFIEGREATLDEQIKVEIDDVRHQLARRYGTAYEYPHPDVRDRIDWERYVSACSPVTSEGFAIQGDNLVYTSTPRVYGKELASRRDAFVKRFLEATGLKAVPPPSMFREKASVLRALARQYRWREQADTEDQWHRELDAERRWLLDTDGGMSFDTTEFDYVPAYATLVERAWQALKPDHWIQREQYSALRGQARAEALRAWKAARRAAKERTVHHCRNTRTHGSKDEPWHTEARPADETAIGWMDDNIRLRSRQMPERPDGPPPGVLKRTPVTVRDVMRLEGALKNALDRYAVHAFNLGKASFVYHR